MEKIKKLLRLAIILSCCGVLLNLGGLVYVSAVNTEASFRRFNNLVFSCSPDYTSYKRSATECCLQCLQDSHCNSVNYQASSRLCEINRNRKIDFDRCTIYFRYGWRVYEKTPCGLGFQSGAHCHHVISAVRTWANALSFCNGLGESLVEVRNQQEQHAFISDVTATGSARFSYVWLGLNDETMLWASGIAATYTHWAYSEPDGPEEECVLFYMNWNDNNVWHDYTCTMQASFVCERRYDYNPL